MALYEHVFYTFSSSFLLCGTKCKFHEGGTCHGFIVLADDTDSGGNITCTLGNIIGDVIEPKEGQGIMMVILKKKGK